MNRLLLVFIFFILVVSCKKETSFNPENFIGKYVTVGFEEDEDDAVIVEKYENRKF